MSVKPKVKKGGLNDQQIQTTVGIVKQYWPNYAISPSDIRNPTREFMLKFYSECANNLQQKCEFVTRSNLASYPSGLCQEELLFLTLSKIPSLVNADFKLGDLFTFDPKRVNNHILITMHFLIFTETFMDKMVQVCNSVFDVKETISHNNEKLKQLKEEKTHKQINITLAKSENKKFKEAAASISPIYKETVILIEELDKRCQHFILKAEKLRSELEIQQKEVQKYEKAEQHLQKQIVTEDEYNNLKIILDSLKKEELNLKEIDSNNDLFEQKHHIEHLQRCLQELNQLHLSEDLCKLSDLRVQLKNEHQDFKYVLAIQQKNEIELEVLKSQLEEQKQVAQTEKIKLQGLLKKGLENMMTNEEILKKKYQQMSKSGKSQIQELQDQVKQIEADIERIELTFVEKFQDACRIQEMALERFELFLSKLKK